MDKSEQMGGGHVAGLGKGAHGLSHGDPSAPSPWTDQHDWKHYLSTNYVLRAAQCTRL